MPKVATRLKGLRVREVSLVDRPANQHARVLLAKRDDREDEESILDKVKKLLGVAKGADEDDLGDLDEDITLFDEKLPLSDVQQLTAALEKSLTSIVDADDLSEEEKQAAAEASLTQFHDTLSGLVDTSTGPDEMKKSEDTGNEEVLKGLAPEHRAEIEKQLSEGKAAREKLEKFELEKAAAEAVVKAKEIVGKANVKPEDLAAVLKQVDAAGAATITDVLAKFNAVIENGSSPLFDEAGVAKGADATGKDSKLEAAADAIQKVDPKLSRPAAIAKALEVNPDLYEDEDSE